MQTQIGLLLQEQSDLSLPILLFWQQFVKQWPDISFSSEERKMIQNFRALIRSLNTLQELPNEMTSSRYSTEEEGYLQSDAESYIRTDDEDGNNTESDWEESMRRWINR